MTQAEIDTIALKVKRRKRNDALNLAAYLIGVSLVGVFLLVFGLYALHTGLTGAAGPEFIMNAMVTLIGAICIFFGFVVTRLGISEWNEEFRNRR